MPDTFSRNKQKIKEGLIMTAISNFADMYDRSMAILLGSEFLIKDDIRSVKPKKRKSKARQRYGNGFEYETISDILEDLDLTFEVLNNKKMQSRAKRILKTVGAFIYPFKNDDDVFINATTANVSPYGLPSVMPIIMRPPNDDDAANIMIFQKMKNYHLLEPSSMGSSIYEIEQIVGTKDKKDVVNGKGFDTNFFCEISEGGEARQLRHVDCSSMAVKRKKGRGYSVIPSKKWALQPVWNGEKESWQIDSDNAKRYATCLFNMAMFREMNANVTVTNKQGFKIVFLVPMHRWKYFFKDRIDVTVNGRKTKIFHYVKAHTRKNGAAVRMHTRGSRHFMWGDYNVSINLQGKHSKSLSSFGCAPEVFDEGPIPEGFISDSEVLNMISKGLGH